jgi:hypothetical protein
MSNKFAAALKSNIEPITEIKPKPRKKEAAEQTTPEGKTTSRAGAKHIGGYFGLEVSKQLRMLSVSEDKSQQDLLAEALDLLFQSRRLPMIAQSKKA